MSSSATWTMGDELEVLLGHLRHTHTDPSASFRIKNVPLYDDQYLDLLVRLSERDPIGYAQVINEIDKITGWGVQVLKSWVSKRAMTGLSLEDFTKATGQKPRVNELTGKPEPDPETGEKNVPRLALSPSKAVTAITSNMLLRISATDTEKTPCLWNYHGQIWKPDGERCVGNLIDQIVGDISNDHGLKETFRRVRAMSDVVVFDSNPYLFPALDKVIDLQTGDAHDYQPEYYLTFQYGAAFNDQAADYRPVLWLLCASLPDPRDVLTALDIATAVFIRVPLEAMVQLIGPGSNGKGVFEKLLIALCTPDRVTAITLAEAKGSRFGPGALLGKDLWILSEVEDVKSAINLLKKVSTGELTDSDTKYGGRTKGKPHVLPILDCNNPVNFGDDSWGRKRRVIKLDYPYVFDYGPGRRHKDPHMLEKVTSPAALSGLLRIIAARGPYLCQSLRIYCRKRPEEMDEEYKRQQFSLAYFSEECLSTEVPNDGGEATQPQRLTTDALYKEYEEYCHLFNVTTPAANVQVGKYIKEKFGISSVNTTVNKVQVRYYPGLWLCRQAKSVYAEVSQNYSNYTETTDELQDKMDENDISRLLTTATTAEWPREVIEEIEKMFKYIQGCEDPQDISYEGYLQSAVVTAVAVVPDRRIAIPECGSVVPFVVAL